MKFVLISRFFSYNFRKNYFFSKILSGININLFFTLIINISRIIKKISSVNTIQLIEHFSSKFECFQLKVTLCRPDKRLSNNQRFFSAR